MSIYKLTQKEFDKTNRSLSEALDVKYQHIQVGDQEFECFDQGNVVPWNKDRPWLEEEKRAISKGRKGKGKSPGKKRTWIQKPHSAEAKFNMSVSCKNRPKTSCILCKKIITGQSNFLQHYKFNH
jgi:hypothetical protein